MISMVRMLKSVQEEKNDPDFLLMGIALTAFLLLLLIAALCLCDRQYRLIERLETFINTATSTRSDEVYGDEMLRRQLEEEKRKKEDPCMRRGRLEDYFHQKGVTMVVNKESFVLHKNHRSLSTHTEHTNIDSSTHCSVAATSTFNSDESPNIEDGGTICLPGGNGNKDDDDEKEDAEEIYLPTPSKDIPRKVPNCCAICLCSYDIGDKVVFSVSSKQEFKGFAEEKNDNEDAADHDHHGRSTRFNAINLFFRRQDRGGERDGADVNHVIPGRCPHAFHLECILDYLQHQIGTPCPCCRREFTDLVPLYKDKETATVGVRATRNGRSRASRYSGLRNGGNGNGNGGAEVTVGNDGEHNIRNSRDDGAVDDNEDRGGGENRTGITAPMTVDEATVIMTNQDGTTGSSDGDPTDESEAV